MAEKKDQDRIRQELERQMKETQDLGKRIEKFLREVERQMKKKD